MSEFSLRRHGTLPPERPSDPANLAVLEPETCALIGATEALHARVARLDAAWRDSFTEHPTAVQRLRERLGRELRIASI